MPKSITEYLRLAGITGDATAPATTALQALLSDAQAEISTASAAADSARNDIQREIRENQQARALAATLRKVAEKAGVDLSALNDSGISAERRRELSDSAGQQVLDYVGGASSEAQDAAAILSSAGFDLDAYRKAGKDKRAELAKAFTDGVAGDKATLRTLQRDTALTALNLDAKKAGRILGDVTLTQGKVTVKDKDGNSAELDTWGVTNADGTFTPAERLIADAGWTMAELAPRPADAGGGATTNATADAGWFIATGQGRASAAQTGGGVLDFLNPPKETP